MRIFNGHYIDVLRFYTEIKKGLTFCPRKYKDNLVSIGVDTWGVSYALLGPDGALLENPGNYPHNRTEGMMKRVLAIIPREEIYKRTGTLSSGNTIYQLFSLVFHKSLILKLVKHFLMLPSLFTFWLTGKRVSEFTDVTTTQLYAPREKRWSDVIFSKLDLPLHIMPNIVSPRTILGSLLPSVKKETRMDRDVKVVATPSHDTAAAVAAIPVQNNNWGFISSGTVSIMGVEKNQPTINSKTFKYNLANEGGVEGTSLLLRNLRGLWLLEECKRAWAGEGCNFSYEDLTKMATASQFRSIIDAHDPIILRSGDIPRKIHLLCKRTGQKTPQNKGDVLRCIFESLALRYRWTLEQLEDIQGKRLETIHIIGGGSQNRLLCQLTADATECRILAGPAEATSIGNIIVQMLAQNRISSLKEARSIIRDSFYIGAYEPHENPGLDERYDQFLRVIEKTAIPQDYY